MGLVALVLAGPGCAGTASAATPNLRPAAVHATVPATTAAETTAAAPAAVRADLVLINARIYTAAGPALAQALAVRHGTILYVGDAAGVKPFIGWRTTLRDVGGRLIVPGLVDSHIHPIDMVALQVCDLNSVAKTLRQLSAFVEGCVKRQRPRPGQWLLVYQWSVTSGNQPDADYPTLRAALDKASPRNPVHALGDDGHHAAFNSAALALARNAAGKLVGLSRATLATDFADFHKFVAIDERGEPSGGVTELVQNAMDPERADYANDVREVLKVVERIPAQLNSAGITAIFDAAAAPGGMAVYDKLLKSRRMTLRATLAQYYDPSRNHTADGHVDYDGMVAKAKVVRERYAGNSLVRADFVKLFADGGVEGNPFAVPPTLGNAAMLEPYLQPMFAVDAGGHATVTGYVDTGSRVCIDARAHLEKYQAAAEAAAFAKANGFHPGQCQISSGQLQYDRAVELEFVRRMHLAGFGVHVHVIGDRTLRTVLDAIEAARAADGVTTTHDSIAHVQLAHPDDVVRMGRDRLFVSYTYSWAYTEVENDMTVIPFLQKLIGNGYASRHAPGSYYEENSYPVRSTKDAGAILAAGSDAPVGTRDPQPFVNMSMAVTRRLPGGPPLNPHQAISIREALDSYTINGARFLGRDKEFGSLEPGKSADFVVLDRDILALADGGKADEIAGTRVLETWFRGQRVYRAPATPRLQ